MENNDFLDKDCWVKEVSANLEKYMAEWLNGVILGTHKTEDIENVVNKVTKYLNTKKVKRRIIEDILRKHNRNKH